MLVAADGSDVVYRRARLEEMVYKVRGQMQYLSRVGVFTVDCGEEEMVKPSDLREGAGQHLCVQHDGGIGGEGGGVQGEGAAAHEQHCVAGGV